MLLPKSHLVRPADYFVTAFDTNPFDTVNKLDAFTIVFKCGACKQEIESEPLMQKGGSLPKDPLWSGIDEVEFAERCRRLDEDRSMSLLLTMEQACTACHQNFVILFGYTEWQPGRDVIELGGVYLLKN